MARQRQILAGLIMLAAQLCGGTLVAVALTNPALLTTQTGTATSPAQSSAAAAQVRLKKLQDEIKNVGLATETTVILVLSTKCDACLDSMGFYKRIASAPGMDGIRKRFVVLATDGTVPMEEHLANRLAPHIVMSYPRMAELEVPPNPPGIIVVDSNGARKGMWLGKLTVAQEAEVLKAIGDSTNSSIGRPR